MKKFILKIFLFAFIVSVLFFLLVWMTSNLLLVWMTSNIVEKRNLHNWDTESNLLVISPNTHYDIIFVGNSHSRNFSRHNNHRRVEKILKRKILNLAKSANVLGNNDYLFYLQYVYSQGITADTIIHNFFSQILISRYNNLASNTFEDEPFRFDFFWQYVKYPYAENKWQRLFYYMSSKLTYKWLSKKPFSLPNYMSSSLTSIDTDKINEGLKSAYRDKIDTSYILRSEKITEELIKTALKHKSQIIFITTPTLFGDWPYHDITLNFMKKMHQKYGIHYYDFANAIKDPHYFYDHHHLNAKGIVYFTKNFLKPALDSGDTRFLVY